MIRAICRYTFNSISQETTLTFFFYLTETRAPKSCMFQTACACKFQHHRVWTNAATSARVFLVVDWDGHWTGIRTYPRYMWSTIINYIAVRELVYLSNCTNRYRNLISNYQMMFLWWRTKWISTTGELWSTWRRRLWKAISFLIKMLGLFPWKAVNNMIMSSRPHQIYLFWLIT